jgi:hypothetical protein
MASSVISCLVDLERSSMRTKMKTIRSRVPKGTHAQHDSLVCHSTSHSSAGG